MKKWYVLLLISLFLPIKLSYAAEFKVQKWQTQNGADVIFYQAKEVPMVDIFVAFAAGSAYDGKAYGLSTLTAQMLDQGNAKFNATQIAESLAKTGAQYQADTTQDMTALHLRSLSEENAFDQATDAFSLIINKPNFPAEAFKREKNILLAAITQAQESPSEVANLTFFAKLYPDHPYGHPIEGTTSSVKNIELAAVRNFYKQFYVANNATIVLVGDLSSEKARLVAEKLTQSLAKGNAAPAIPQAKQLTDAQEIKVPFPASQTVIRMGQIGISHHVGDYFPLIVGNYILGGGALVSRLAHEVREQRGLSYGVSSQFLPMPGDGPFIIGLSTQTKQAQLAFDVTLETLKNFLKSGPTDEELTAAKQYLTGSFPLSLASNRGIAHMLLHIYFYKLPENYLDTYTARLEAVSADEIKKAFAKQVNPQNLLTVMVGQQ